MKSNAEAIGTTANFAKLATDKAGFDNIDPAIKIVVNDIEMHSKRLLDFSKNLLVESKRVQIDLENALDEI